MHAHRFVQSLPVLLLLLVSSLSWANQGFHSGESAVEKLDYEALLSEAVSLDESTLGQQIVDECVAHYGGEEKLAQLGIARLEYSMESSFSKQGVKVVRTFAPGRRHKLEKPSETRILDDRNAWYVKGEQIVDLSGTGRYKAELFSWLTLSMPGALKSEPFDDIRYGTRKDDPLAYIYLNKADSLIMVLGIDPETHLIKSSEGFIRQEDQGFVFVNYFDDHREVDGYLFAHRLINIAMGLQVGTSELVSVQINPKLESDAFDPPFPAGSNLLD